MEVLTEIIPRQPGSRVPLLIEVPIAPGLDGPFLVTAAKKKFIWVQNKFPTGVVRAAIRQVPLGFLFREALLQVASQSRKNDWGSFHPADTMGLARAAAHVHSYGLEDLQVIYGKGFPEVALPDGLPHREVVWVPAGWAVVVPTDRSYVGTTVDFSSGRHAMVLHNASRGIGIAAPVFLVSEHLGTKIRGLLPHSCETLFDLSTKTSGELLEIKGFGEKTLGRVREALGEVGLFLADEA